MEQAKRHADQCCNQHTCPQVSAQIDGEPAGEGSSGHDAFNAEVEHAGALADQFAHGGEDQRRGDADGGDPEGGGEQDFESFHQRHLILYRDSMIAVTIVNSEVATMTSAM